MGVDGIGGGGGRPVDGARPAEISPPGEPAAPEISPAGGAAGVPGAAPAAPASALTELQRGEIDLERYLDARVVEATRHLDGRLSASQIDFIRRTLREELASDPVLVELVRRTTGELPMSRAE